MSIGLILSGLAVLLIGIAWFIQRGAVNGILFLVMVLVFLSAAVTSSYLKIIFSVLSALIAASLLMMVVKRKMK